MGVNKKLDLLYLGLKSKGTPERSPREPRKQKGIMFSIHIMWLRDMDH